MYAGRMMWGVRRHDVGDRPVIQVIEGNEAEAEEIARSMVEQMTEISERNGWDNAPELVQCKLIWKVVRTGPYPSNVTCVCGELIHPDMPYVEEEPTPAVLWHGNPEGGGHKSNARLT